MKFTDEHIEKGKQHTVYTLGEPHHEHNDCIRLCAEWLSAQQWVKRPTRRKRGLKHIIESWAGRYVSVDDVSVAATLLGLQGRYPCFNIASRLTRPSMIRLVGIGEALKHKDYLGKYDGLYSLNEDY